MSLRSCWQRPLAWAVVVGSTMGLALLTPAPAGAQAEEPAVEETAPSAPPSAIPSPMEMFIAFSRTQLQSQGFVRQQAVVAGQPMVWWEKGSESTPDGPTLVLVHGVSDQAGTWFQISAGLAEGHRLLLVDLPGHGESGPADGPLAMTTVLDGFGAWLAEHGVPAGGSEVPAGGSGGVTLVGNSMGAWVALATALKQPEKVARVVMVNGGPLQVDTGDLDLLPADREEARRLMAALRDPSHAATPDVVLDDLVRRAPHGQVQRMFEAQEDLESHLMSDGADGLGRVTTPVDILWGASDRYLGRAYAERLLAGLPRARLTWIETCGHLPQAECPQDFAAALQEVLAQPPPAAGSTSEAAPQAPQGDDDAS